MTLDIELILNQWGLGKVIAPGGPIKNKIQIGPFRFTYIPWSELNKHAINFEIGIVGPGVTWKQDKFTGEVLPVFPKTRRKR